MGADAGVIFKLYKLIKWDENELLYVGISLEYEDDGGARVLMQDDALD